MGESEEKNALWEFADSPFTWGGIGLILGAAIVSPALFKFAFIAAGVSVAIGFLRARAFKGKSITTRILLNLIILACMAFGWRSLWGWMPKPVEPPTPDQIAERVVQKIGTRADNNNPAPKPSKSTSENEIADAIVKKLPKNVQNLDLSNGDLRSQAKDAAERLHKNLDPEVVEYFRVQALPNESERMAGLAQVKSDFLSNPENKALFAKENYLRDSILARLGKPIPKEKYFNGEWPGSTGGFYADQLVDLANKLP
jgi:hypothetical protein